MLVSPNGRAVIVTPTKTATKSLEAALKPQGWVFKTPRHSLPLDPDIMDQARKVALMIRNPYARLVSMYTFGQTSKHSTLLRWGLEGFEAFCSNWADAFDSGVLNRDWTTTYDKYAEHLYRLQQAQARSFTYSVFRIEDGLIAPLEYLKAEKVVEKHVNKSHDKIERPLWTQAALDAIGDRLLDDLRLGEYPRQRPQL